MASGKSLELREIRQAPPEILCICGKVWDSSTHFTQKGELRKNLDRNTHRGTAARASRSMFRRPSNRRPRMAKAKRLGSADGSS